MTSPPSKTSDLRALAAKVPEGPWFAGNDEAEDAPVHGKTLAMVDTGRSADWPIARLAEWPTASYLAAVDPQTVVGLLDEIERLREALDIACSREWSGYIHDYQRGHLSYHGMLKAKPLLWERVERNLREAKP